MEKTLNVRLKAAGQHTSINVATAELHSRTVLMIQHVWLIPIM